MWGAPRETGRAWWAAAGLIVACLTPAPASGGSISISMTAGAELREGQLAVQLTVRNQGDEAAQSVTPTVRFGEHEARGTGTQALAPQQSFEETLRVPAGDLGPGRWPCRIAVDYTDANHYPFQALHVLLVTVGNPPPAKVLISGITGTRVSGRGTLEIKLKNLTAEARTPALQLFAPDSLEVAGEPPAITLDGWEEESVSLPLINRTALAGSSLPVFAAVQYDDAGVHQAVVAHALIEVVPAQSFFAEHRGLLALAALVLVVGWAGFLAARRARRA